VNGYQYAATVSVVCTFGEGKDAQKRIAFSVVSGTDINRLFFSVGSEARRHIDELSRGFRDEPSVVIKIWVASAESVALRGEGFSEPFICEFKPQEARTLYQVMDQEVRQHILDHLHTS
jgi:hypothetical protein